MNDFELLHRKGRKRNGLTDQCSPFCDLDCQVQNPFCVLASLRLCAFALKFSCLTAWFRLSMEMIQARDKLRTTWSVERALFSV
jgi:hypothetical protein